MYGDAFTIEYFENLMAYMARLYIDGYVALFDFLDSANAENIQWVTLVRLHN